MGFDGNQWAIVALVFVLGWLVGLLSRGGAGRWRRQARAEEAARIAAEDRLATANARVAELERASPIRRDTGASAAPVAAGQRDDLAIVQGIGRERELRLNEEGIHGYRDLERMTDADAAALENRMGLAAGTIAREHWREQAATLRNEGLEAHRTRYL